MRGRYRPAWAAPFLLLLHVQCAVSQGSPYPWLRDWSEENTLAVRIQPPPGFERIPSAAGSFASWLRGLPLRAPGAPVRLYDGTERWSQRGVYAVLDMDVGRTDLQQCADAVIRLRAEYLRQSGARNAICFSFTSGHRACWSDWRAGRRPRVSGSAVSWTTTHGPDSSYQTFREYLSTVFTYAGTFSLARELARVADPSSVLPGDVFIEGGFPGHAVLVADVARNSSGENIMLLLQSYMPAQDVHVLRNPADPDSPWYRLGTGGVLETPDWTFSRSDLRRFPAPP